MFIVIVNMTLIEIKYVPWSRTLMIDSLNPLTFPSQVTAWEPAQRARLAYTAHALRPPKRRPSAPSSARPAPA